MFIWTFKAISIAHVVQSLKDLNRREVEVSCNQLFGVHLILLFAKIVGLPLVIRSPVQVLRCPKAILTTQ